MLVIYFSNQDCFFTLTLYRPEYDGSSTPKAFFFENIIPIRILNTIKKNVSHLHMNINIEK